MDPLLEPFDLGSLTLKNRIVTTAHAPLGYTHDGLMTERYLRYQEEKAIGGIGLVMFGGSSFVAPDAHSFFESINAGDPRIQDDYADLSARVRAHGARTIVQISHLGRRADDHATWLPTLAPSPIRERAHRTWPKVIEDFDVPRILAAYARAARYALEGGLDGVEVMAGSGHLPDTFLAPRANRRTDRYGGSLENRARFLVEVLGAIRAEVGTGFAVGVRLPGEESSADGLSGEDCVEIAAHVTAHADLDFVDVMYGSGFTHRELAQQIPSAGTALGFKLAMAQAVRAVVDVPVIHAGRIADLATARHALREDLIDLVGMTRSHIADPHIVRKLMAGEEERIRPCVGASHCLQGNDTLCIHNPATSRETFIPQLTSPATHRLRVTVVGGGPAGLEAARVSAERGHDVTLYEAASQFGGQVLPMTRSARQSEKRSITEWLVAEAKHAGARLLANHYVDEDDLLKETADVVIVATGGMPDTDLPQGGGDLTLSSVDVLGKAAPSGRTVLVFDDHGGEQALVVAEHYLEGQDNTVELVTVDEHVGHDVGHTIMPGYKSRLLHGGVTLTTDTELLSVEKVDGRLCATLRNVASDAVSQRVVDVVVVEQGTLAMDDVYEALKPHSSNGGALDLERFRHGLAQPESPEGSGFRLFRVGDAVSHRGIHAAIYDARRLCQNL